MLQNETLQEQAQNNTNQTPFVNQAEPTTKETFQSSTEHLMTVEENPKGQRRTARVETYATTQTNPAQQIIQPTINQPQGIQTQKSEKPAKGDKDSKVPVVQRITDNTGKDLFMAEVIVMNANKELIAKTKTNAAGKWQAYLKPGKYSVNIVKTDTATKNKLEAMQDITVSNSDKTITLPVMIIKR
jgi:hypothetical protein